MRNKKQTGQGTVEYALILVLGLIATLLVLQTMGISISDVYCRVAGGFTNNGCSQTLCKDDFSNLSGILQQSGIWSVTNGQLCNQGGGIVYNKCSMSNFSTTDYSVNLDGATLAAGNGYGIFFRASNTGSGTNGYAFQYDPGLKGFVVRKWVTGWEINPPIVFKATPGFDWYGKPHTLKVKVVGNTFTGYVDGQEMLTGQDSTYTSGGGGIRTWDSTNLCIDQFSVTSIGQ